MLLRATIILGWYSFATNAFLAFIPAGSCSRGISNEGECGVTPKIQTTGTSASSSTVDSSSPSSSSLTRKPKSGDIVTFTLESFKPTNDDVLEPLFDTKGTLQLVLNGGNYLPGLHKLLSTMNPGETVKGVNVDAGYGGYNKELEFQISTSDLGPSMDTSLVKVGTVLRMQNCMECRVTKIEDDKWTLDANHPLAGAAYEIDVKLDKVEEGPQNWEYVKDDNEGNKYKVATVALGCFWGGELAYQRMPGVVSTEVGYTQGEKENPTYEEVCTGKTGHTEAIRVIYNVDVVSYQELVQLGLDRLDQDVFKLNQVGNDRGTQYRSGIYYHNDSQKKVAEELLAKLGSGDSREVQTELKEATIFYKAEEYHQQYLLKGGQSAKKKASETIRCYG